MKPNEMMQSAVIVALALMTSTTAGAASVPFTETFEASVEGWEDSVNDPMSWVATGGADGGGYASATFNYFGYASAFGGGPVVFRASAADLPSGGAFIGDWLAAGVGMVTARVRHDAPEPLNFYARVATAANFPGAVLTSFALVPANVWTEIRFAVTLDSPACVGEGAPCSAANFQDVGNLQFGTDAPAGLLDDDFAYTLDLDLVSLVPVPEPGTALLVGLGLAGLAASGRRERARR
jgi:hypothetical protein